MKVRKKIESALPASAAGQQPPFGPASSTKHVERVREVRNDDDHDHTVINEKIFFPIETFKDFNFVGRILGPKGQTLKQLQAETGCKIQIRGKGSYRKHGSVEPPAPLPGSEEALHLFVTAEGTFKHANSLINAAFSKLRPYLDPAARIKTLVSTVTTAQHARPKQDDHPEEKDPSENVTVTHKKSQNNKAAGKANKQQFFKHKKEGNNNFPQPQIIPPEAFNQMYTTLPPPPPQQQAQSQFYQPFIIPPGQFIPAPLPPGQFNIPMVNHQGMPMMNPPFQMPFHPHTTYNSPPSDEES